MITEVKSGQLHSVDDRGFSLVELIICVAILAIATIPLMKAFSLAANVNGRAQKQQNATSLAESIMEEVKSKSIDELIVEYNGLKADGSGDPNVTTTTKTETDLWDPAVTARDRADIADSESTSVVNVAKKGAVLSGGAATTPFYVLYIPGVTATQGQTYDATVSVRTSTYTNSSTEASSTANVSGANSVKLPKIEEIDTLTQTVLTMKEFSKYDQAAWNYFCQRRKDYIPASTEGGTDYQNAASITEKDITINKVDVSGMTNTVSVKCSVTYFDDSTPVQTFTRDLFTGTYSSESSTLNSNIYLFYKSTQAKEKIIVKDDSAISSHKVYLVMQNDNIGNRIADITGTEIDITGAGEHIFFDKNHYDDLESGTIKNGGLEFISNLGNSAAASGYIYKEEASIRLYDIVVELTQSGHNEAFATLKSTMQR